MKKEEVRGNLRQTVADLFLIGVESQLRVIDLRSWRRDELDITHHPGQDEGSRRIGIDGDSARGAQGSL